MKILNLFTRHFFASVTLFTLLPLLALFFYIYQGMNEVERMAFLEEKVLEEYAQYKHKERYNRIVFERHRDSDHHYIEKYLETPLLLKNEQERLEEAISSPYPLSEEVKKRFLFFQNGGNTLSFVEGDPLLFQNIQETIETQTVPVEVDLEDLSYILSVVEPHNFDKSKGAPQLLFLHFSLERKRVPSEEEVFLLNTKILKREFL